VLIRHRRYRITAKYIIFSYYINWALRNGCNRATCYGSSTGTVKNHALVMILKYNQEGQEMSRLIDKLNRISQTAPQPMGFTATQPISQKPKLLLIASLPQVNIDGPADYVTGADGGLIHIHQIHQSSEAKALKEVSQAISDIPWGMRLRDSGQPEMKQIMKTDCDFVVFPADKTSLTILQNEAIGKILEVEASLSDGLLRAVNELPIDAVLITDDLGEDYILTWHHLLLFQHFANFLTKPLLVSIPSNVTANELQALWEAGVDGAIVEIDTGHPGGRISKLRQTIDKLSFPSRRKQRKTEALLPHIGQDKSPAIEEEEEEE
jgi:hypothetical protein